MAYKKSSQTHTGFFSRVFAHLRALVQSSVIFGLFLAYTPLNDRCKDSRICRFLKLSPKTKERLLAFKLRFAAQSERSRLLRYLEQGAERFFRSSLRSFGIFLLSFGGFLVSFHLANDLPRLMHLDFSDTFLFGCILVLASLFMLPVKNKSIAACLRASRILSYFLLDIFTLKHLTDENEKKPHSSSGFFLFFGFICGLFSYVVSPKVTLFLLFSGVLVYMTLTRPENGVLAVCLLLPFADTRILVFLILLTFVSELFKVFRAKRAFRFNLCSGVCVLLGAIAFSAWVVSFDAQGADSTFASLACVLLFAVLVIALIRSSTLADKCFRTLALSALASALYGAYSYLTVILFGSHGFERFPTVSRTMLHSVFSPSSFPCFLICMLPLLYVNSRRSGKLFSLLGFASVLLCLLFGDSYYALLAFVGALVLVMLLFHRQRLFTCILAVLCLGSFSTLIPKARLSDFDLRRYMSLPDELIPLGASSSDGLPQFFRKLWFCGAGIGDEAIANASVLTEVHTIGTPIGASYTTLACKLGLPLLLIGLLLVFVFISRLLSYAYGENRSESAKKKCTALICGLFSFFLYALFVDVTSDFRLCLLVFLLLSLGSAVTDSADSDYIPAYFEREYN